MTLIIVVYFNLVAAYVSRREELVLKRLRTGEVSDREILAGTALPPVTLAVVQCAILVAAAVAFLDVRAPQRPELLVGGAAVGLVLLTALAAVTAGVTRTVESAQITTMPLFLVSAFGSGLFLPLEVFPERIAAVCELLPFTGVMTVIRAGWLGIGDGGELLRAGVAALVWTAVSVFAVQRWFRWEPRSLNREGRSVTPAGDRGAGPNRAGAGRAGRRRRWPGARHGQGPRGRRTGAWPELTGWWSRRSHPEKVELYTRWTYHGLAAVELLLGGPPAAAVAVGSAEGAGPAGGWLLLLLLTHTVLVAALCSCALSWQLGRRPRSRGG